MVAAIIGLVLLVALVLVAVRLISLRHASGETNNDMGDDGSLIHTSGIYSIFRKSPREDLVRIRPSEAEIRKYLASLNEDLTRRPLSPADRQQLADNWRQSMEENIKVVEQGDAAEVEFYYYDFPGGSRCPVCASYLNQGQFVSRQEIFNNPPIIPPFHLGCITKIVAYRGKENLRETTSSGMAPFFSKNVLPPIPEWTNIVKLT